MATVYLARDLRHDRHVALKVLQPELAAVLGAERFLARDPDHRQPAASAHPAAVRQRRGRRRCLFYVMPFVEGESLRDRLTREKQLPVDDARADRRARSPTRSTMRTGTASIHRDIKPENILLHDGSALVADFGIALAAQRRRRRPADGDRPRASARRTT